MKKYSSRAQFEALHPRTHGRPTPPVITDEDRARRERRRRLELLTDERAREAELDHFGDPAEEL